MSDYPPITSLQNERVKLARRLLEKRYRQHLKRLVVNYSRDLAHAINHSYEIDYVFVCDAFLTSEDQRTLDQISNAQIFNVTENVMAKVNYRENPTGLLAVLHQPDPLRLEDISPDVDRILVLTALNKPGNIGALLRTADGAGFKSVLLVDTALDLYNPNIIRSSTGACFLGNIAVTDGIGAIDFLRRRSYRLIAGHLKGRTNLFDTNLLGRIAVVMGTEETGLTDEWTDWCDVHLQIPMAGQLIDSLNVSVAGAIIMYETLRQHAANDHT